MKKDSACTLDDIMAATNKTCGEGTMFKGTGLARDPNRLPFGVFAVDFATGGGVPLWGTMCLWGKECVAEDTEIICRTSDYATGKMHSQKRITIGRLFERFHNLCSGKGRYVREQTKHAKYTVAAVNEELGVFHNEVLDVVRAGEKTCFRVKSSTGLEITATADHKFMLPDGTFSSLGELSVGDVILIHDNTPNLGRKTEVPSRQEVLVKYHPYWPTKVVNGCTYYRGKYARMVVEAQMNGMTNTAYVALLNTGSVEEIDKLKFLRPDQHVHHKDKVVTNNSRKNLEVVDGAEHNRSHSLENHNKLRFMAVPDTITSIDSVGSRMTYDIMCPFPHNNYVANGFVVHNSGGKSSLSINAIKMAQLICWRCFNLEEFCTCSTPALRMDSVYADIEGTLDRTWAHEIGADPNRYHVVLADYAEQYANIADNVLKADNCGLLIVDSLAALTPEAEMEKAAEDDFYALQARVIGRMVRKLKQRLIVERKRNHPCTILFINQMRMKVGVVFGNPESMPGGWGMKHEFSIVLRIVKSSLKEPDKKYIASGSKKDPIARFSFSIKKEKVLTLAGVGEFLRVLEPLPERGLRAGVIADHQTVLTYAKEYGIVKKSGSKDKPWKFLKYNARTLDDVMAAWLKKDSLYLHTQMEIVKLAKKRLQGE